MNELYNDHERRLDTITGRAQFWPAVAAVCRDHVFNDSLALRDFMLAEYGVEITKVSDGWSPEYHIKDEQKYLLFLLKYTK